MHKILLLIFLFALVVQTNKAQTADFKDAFIPKSALNQKTNWPDKASNNYLISVYGQIKYPAKARKWGATGTYAIDFTVLKDGSLTVDSIIYLGNFPLADKPNELENIIVKGYLVPLIDSHGYYPPRASVKARKKSILERAVFTLLGRKYLEQEIARVFNNHLPYTSATFCGEPINWSYRRYLRFDLE
jgi:hypothetical protein